MFVRHSIVNQAALTTLSRLSLYLGHKHGKEFLRANLDYLVDEMCFILRSIRQSTEGIDDVPPHTRRGAGAGGEDEENPFFSFSGLIDSAYDDRIVRVVGAVFFEIQQEVSSASAAPQEEKEVVGSAVVMLLRDLIHESLNVIDALCQSSTSYAEITREDEHTRTRSSPHAQQTYSLDYQRGQVASPPLPTFNV
jgi:hypothetical protein